MVVRMEDAEQNAAEQKAPGQNTGAARKKGSQLKVRKTIGKNGTKRVTPAITQTAGKTQYRKVSVPPHRMTPLKQQWASIYEPVVKQLKLQIRMNLSTKAVELKTCKTTCEPSALQKGADFVKAFVTGFEVQDAIAILRLEELYIESFEVTDVKELKGDHLSRAIGRLAGKDGKTKFTIENATKTRIVLADSKIHILGTFMNIRLARQALVSLILGAPPGKVYNRLKSVAARLNERF
ncbi:Pre-rRNA-processing protein PNO1 [Porphyridium purpureum]|uniref:Pre-rRNA-processing protein PNO1 n=1 Tax=Porphyridium purpureum TaxID=35688 RepID=A0A5J4Z6P0_PORPP|nr:Pre-rRNA-processing protein PNO1 [Porphyridium purpureum]|eukprot:POR8398..scf295_1